MMTDKLDWENLFFGRKSILELIKRRVIDLKEGYRQNLALLGNRYLGKTSILRQFLANLDDEEIIEIYLDLENKDFDYLFSKFVGSILYNFSKVKKLDLHEDIELLLENTKKFIPHTVQEIRKIQTYITKGKLTDAYLDLISLPEVFTVESGKFCIIILDEFHSLEDLMIPNAFKELGKKVMTQKRCIYIVASSAANVAKKILSERLSLLFGNFEIVEVAAFDLKTSQAFIDENLKTIKMGLHLKNFLIDFTGGHPFYLSLIVQEVIRLSELHGQSEIFLPLLTQAIENLIFNRWGILSQHFDVMMHNLCQQKGNRAMAAILISLANGKHKIKDMAGGAGVKGTVVNQKMNRLIELGMVTKNGNHYYFQDKLLRFWIKYVYQKRLTSIHENLKQQGKYFRAEIEQSVNGFQAVSQKDLFSRIVDLLHCFDNDAFQLSGRRYKLPLFSEITPFKFENITECPFEVIKASSNEEIWIIILKEGTLLEGEVNAFLTEAKKLGERVDRRVIISLSGLDANARLRALQEKMWIWNEKELNTLLNLFDKPYIVTSKFQ